MKKLVSLIAFLLLSFASISYATSFWDADVLVSYPDINITLKSDNGTINFISKPRIQQYLNARDRISQISGIYPKVLITDEPQINAFAQNSNGQGTVMLTIKIIDMIGDDQDAVAAIIGHEITHIYKNHMDIKATRNAVFEILGGIAGVALNVALNSKGIPGGIGGDIANIGTTLFTTSYERDQEREADEYGTKWMIQAGYNPQGAIRLHQNLMRQSNGIGISFLSTHPSSQERIANLEKIIATYKEEKVITTNSIIKKIEQTSSASSNIPVPNEGLVGVVVNIKSKYKYLIFSSTTSSQLEQGLNVLIKTDNNKIIHAKVDKSFDGYYSAVVDEDMQDIGIGNRIEYQSQSKLKKH